MHHGDSLDDDYVPGDNLVAVEDDDAGVSVEDDDGGLESVEDSHATGSDSRPAENAKVAKKRKRREQEKEKKAKVHMLSPSQIFRSLYC